MGVSDPSAALLRMLETAAAQRSERQAELDRLSAAADDYEELVSTLTELPKRVSHKVLVPFGKLAFFPGELRHTNEIMCLLGDNYFALRSAEQAAAMADRRAQYVRPQVAAARADVDELTRQIEQIRAYGAAQDVQPGQFEIREPYCSDDDGDGDGGAGSPIAEEEEEEDDDDDDDDDDDHEDRAAVLAKARAAAGLTPAADGEARPREGQSTKKTVSWGGPGATAAGRARVPDSDDDDDDDDDDLCDVCEVGAGAGPGALAAQGRRGAATQAARAMTDAASTRQRAPASAARPVAAATTAFAETVVERQPSGPPPTETDVLMREVERQKAVREQQRAMRVPMPEATAGPPQAESPAANDGGGGARVSRFMANRRRQPQA